MNMSSGQDSKEERISIYNTRKVYIPIYLMAILLVAAVISLKINGHELNKYALIGAGLFALASIKMTEIHRLTNKYEIGDSTLDHIQGLFSKINRKLDFFAISDLDVSQTPWQRMLNFGDVNVRLFSKESVAKIKGISNPLRFANILQERILNCRKNVSQIRNKK
jgi:hypothetical protein